MDDQQVNRYARQFGRQWRYAQQIIVTIAIVDFKVIVFTISKFGKTTSKCFKKWSKTRFSLSGEPSNPKDLGRCVRALQPIAIAITALEARNVRRFIFNSPVFSKTQYNLPGRSYPQAKVSFWSN